MPAVWALVLHRFAKFVIEHEAVPEEPAGRVAFPTYDASGVPKAPAQANGQNVEEWAGVLMMVVGFGIDGYLALQKLFFGAELANRPLLLFGAVLMLAGLQIASLGILAELQIRTYHESQGKPIYTVREIIGSPSERS